jgi:hypothetical protein
MKMRRSLSTLVLSAAAAVGLVLTGVAPADATPRATVHVDIAANGAVHMRHAIPAGFLKFDVDGADGHALQLARPKHHASVATLVKDSNALETSGSAKGIERHFTAIGGTETHTDLWVHLRNGLYYAFDTGGQKLTARHVVVLHVGHGYAVADRPRVGATIRAVGEMSWARWPKHIPSHGVLAFRNESTEYHFVQLTQLKPGTTLAQVKAGLASPNPPSFALSGSYSTGVLSPYRSQLSTYRLPEGLYALMCFWPDEHGVPHALMGMVRLIRVG